MSFIKWLVLVFPFLSSSSGLQQPTSLHIKKTNQVVVQASCKPFPECEIEALEAQGH